MLSPAQLAANAANAQHSTGPRTPDGKARSSQNARKHGLTSRDLVVRADEVPEFQELHDSLYDELQPQGALEHDLFRQLIHASWNLRRVRRLEVEASCGEGCDRLSRDRAGDTFDRYARYHAKWERSYYRALRELRDLQTNRALRAVLPAPQPAEPLPLLVSIAEMTKRTRHLPPNPPVQPPLPPSPFPPSSARPAPPLSGTP